MRVFIDADACPVVSIVENISKKYNIPVTLLCDTNHVLTSEYSEVIVVGAGADAVDYKLISICHRGGLRHPRPGGSPHHERHRSRNEQRTHSADRLAYRYL